MVELALGRAEQAASANTLLDRVESLIAEFREIASQAQKKKNWTGAVGALREVRGCLDLLGRLSGQLQAAASLSFHRHLHVEGQSTPIPKTEAEIDSEIAELVRQSTNNFDIREFHRLRLLLQPCAVLEGASDYRPNVPEEVVP